MKIISLLLLALALTGCSGIEIQQYKNNQPKLILNEFFNGELSAHGIVKNRSGEVIRYFNVTMTGSWNEQGVGLLEEKFIFDDGEIQYRTWTFSPVTINNTTQYIAKANDTVNPVPVAITGNAFFMDYDLIIDYKGDDLEVNIADKMYLISDTVIINESVMTKYGIEVGYITLTILKSSH